MYPGLTWAADTARGLGTITDDGQGALDGMTGMMYEDAGTVLYAIGPPLLIPARTHVPGP